MTIAKQALLTDLDYSAWANQRLLDACSALTAEEMDRNLGASHGGVIRTLRHIYYAERVWMKRLRANSLPPLHEVGDQRLFGDAPPEPGLESLKKSWPDVWASMREWFEDLPEAELASELSCRLPNGGELRLAQWKILLADEITVSAPFGRVDLEALKRPRLGGKEPSDDDYRV